jgi:hypothetical protein
MGVASSNTHLPTPTVTQPSLTWQEHDRLQRMKSLQYTEQKQTYGHTGQQVQMERNEASEIQKQTERCEESNYHTHSHERARQSHRMHHHSVNATTKIAANATTLIYPLQSMEATEKVHNHSHTFHKRVDGIVSMSPKNDFPLPIQSHSLPQTLAPAVSLMPSSDSLMSSTSSAVMHGPQKHAKNSVSSKSGMVGCKRTVASPASPQPCQQRRRIGSTAALESNDRPQSSSTKPAHTLTEKEKFIQSQSAPWLPSNRCKATKSSENSVSRNSHMNVGSTSKHHTDSDKKFIGSPHKNMVHELKRMDKQCADDNKKFHGKTKQSVNPFRHAETLNDCLQELIAIGYLHENEVFNQPASLRKYRKARQLAYPNHVIPMPVFPPHYYKPTERSYQPHKKEQDDEEEAEAHLSPSLNRILTHNTWNIEFNVTQTNYSS